MGMSREDIIQYARRYVTENLESDFPGEGDLFCFLHRKLDQAALPEAEAEWSFGGYGVCMEYVLDKEAKPAGKWVWMSYASLDSFPPQRRDIKLQPPHIVKGRFQSPDRTTEIRIMRIPAEPRAFEQLDAREAPRSEQRKQPDARRKAADSAPSDSAPRAKVLRFPRKTDH